MILNFVHYLGAFPPTAGTGLSAPIFLARRAARQKVFPLLSLARIGRPAVFMHKPVRTLVQAAKPAAGVILVCLTAFFFTSCSAFKKNTAVLWTDSPEFALYAQMFNAAQSKYKIEVHERRELGKELEDLAADKKKRQPDIVVGKWLKSAQLASIWQKPDFLFKKKSIDKDIFYSSLLNFGKTGRDQIFLPVSFNLGAIVFLSDTFGTDAAQPAASKIDQTFINLEDIKKRAIEFNIHKNGMYSRIGFSPAWNWNGDFLYAAAQMYGASFTEAPPLETQPLTWNPESLEKAIAAFREWINDGNGGAAAEDEFIFKYSYDPSDRLIERGRILFAYIKSDRLFKISREELSRLDYRWLTFSLDGQDTIPVLEDVLLFGITKKCTSKSAVAAFVKWFYAEYTQKELLEKSRAEHLSEFIFGIGNGFSAVRGATEFIYPQMYPALLSHIPPDGYLLEPPRHYWNWNAIKDRVVIPYIRERVKTEHAVRPLEQRLADWHRLNNRGIQSSRLRSPG